MKKQVLYGVADYEELVRDNGYFVDKTPYIEKLEQINNPVFLRPKRFGKSLFCRMLECYYNIRQKDEFEALFGHTYIGRHPTQLRNSFFVLYLDFSTADPSGAVEEIERDFNAICNLSMETVANLYRDWFQNEAVIIPEETASSNLCRVLSIIQRHRLPPLYVIIDEYDNFANRLIVRHKDVPYYDLTGANSFFNILKAGRKTGTVANVFITGVLPITIDDLTSGFNIGTFITLAPDFEDMLGFTQSEVNGLLDEVYHDYQLDPSTRNEVATVIRNQYNGYHFASPDGESLYNSTILMYFLSSLCRLEGIPRHLTDLNLKTDISWVRRLTASDPRFTEEFVDQLTLHNSIRYDEVLLTEKFNMSQFF